MSKRKIKHDLVSAETEIKRKRYCVPHNETSDFDKKKEKSKRKSKKNQKDVGSLKEQNRRNQNIESTKVSVQA